jgi:hypothetical protein
MRLTLALAVVLLAASRTGQVEHAPTVAQCQADQRLWFPKVEQNPTDPGSLPHYSVLTDWSIEMDDCEKVDPENARKYTTTETEIAYIQLGRLRHFIQRHQMWDKFLAEDDADKR